MEYFLIDINGQEYEVEADFTTFDAEYNSPAQVEVELHRVFKKDEHGDYNEYTPSQDEEHEIIQQVAEQVLEEERYAEMDYGDVF